jgi:hypothetical protein
MKRFSLTSMIAFFLLLLNVTEIMAQKDKQAEKLNKALKAINCAKANDLVQTVKSVDYTDEDGNTLLTLSSNIGCIDVKIGRASCRERVYVLV